MTIDPDLLAAFRAVVDCGGFTRAAERLHRTQSTISAQIKRLEERLGCRVLDREAGAVVLTADGERLLARARRLLDLNDELISEFRGEQPAGHVRVGVPADYATAFLGDLLPFISRRFPAVTVDVQSDLSPVLMQQLERDRLDLVVATRMSAFRAPGQVLERSPLLWVGARGGTAHERDPLPVAVFPSGCFLREEALRALDAAGVAYRVVYQSPGIEGITASVRADFAIAAVAANGLPPRLAELTGTGLPPLPDVEIALYTRPQAQEPVRSMADYLTRHLTGQAGGALTG